MDRRGMFFLIAAAVCAALIPVAEEDLRFVPQWLAVTYVLLAVLSFLDAASRSRRSRQGRS